jgi:hypothetical protein
MRFLMALLLLCIGGAAQAGFVYPELPQSGAGLREFVPAGWRVLAEARGDLSKDGTDDIAAVIETVEPVEHVPGCDTWRDQSSREARMFVVLLADGGGFRLEAENRTIVLRADEGGVFGDPFLSLEILRGTVVLRHYGGSAWRWASTYRFRRQDGGWFLIGYTDDAHHTLSRYERQYDFNPLTGKVKITTTGSEGETGCYRCFKGERCPAQAGCETDEAQARQKETWKSLGKRPLIAMREAACVQILPFAPYE